MPRSRGHAGRCAAVRRKPRRLHRESANAVSTPPVATEVATETTVSHRKTCSRHPPSLRTSAEPGRIAPARREKGRSGLARTRQCPPFRRCAREHRFRRPRRTSSWYEGHYEQKAPFPRSTKTSEAAGSPWRLGGGSYRTAVRTEDAVTDRPPRAQRQASAWGTSVTTSVTTEKGGDRPHTIEPATAEVAPLTLHRAGRVDERIRRHLTGKIVANAKTLPNADALNAGATPNNPGATSRRSSPADAGAPGALGPASPREACIRLPTGWLPGGYHETKALPSESDGRRGDSCHDRADHCCVGGCPPSRASATPRIGEVPRSWFSPRLHGNEGFRGRE